MKSEVGAGLRVAHCNPPARTNFVFHAHSSFLALNPPPLTRALLRGARPRLTRALLSAAAKVQAQLHAFHSVRSRLLGAFGAAQVTGWAAAAHASACARPLASLAQRRPPGALPQPQQRPLAGVAPLARPLTFMRSSGAGRCRPCPCFCSGQGCPSSSARAPGSGSAWPCGGRCAGGTSAWPRSLSSSRGGGASDESWEGRVGGWAGGRTPLPLVRFVHLLGWQGALLFAPVPGTGGRARAEP